MLTPGQRDLWVDVDDQGGAEPLFSNRPRPVAAAVTDLDPSLQREVPLDVGGRRWRVRLTLAPGYFTRNRPLQAWTILAAGLLFTGLLGILLLEATERLTIVESLVRLRTDELDRASATLRAQNVILGAGIRDRGLLSAYQPVTALPARNGHLAAGSGGALGGRRGRARGGDAVGGCWEPAEEQSGEDRRSGLHDEGDGPAPGGERSRRRSRSRASSPPASALDGAVAAVRARYRT